MVNIRLTQFGYDPIVGDIVRNGDTIKELVEEELTEYTIKDILLPLPGTDMVYPSQMVSVYKAFMELDNLDPLKMNHAQKYPHFYFIINIIYFIF